MAVDFVPADTTPEAAWVQMEIYRRMGGARRLELAFELSDFLRGIVESGIRSRHPDYDDQQVKLAYIRLTVGYELFGKAFPGVKIAI
jgi:hypothetical protein